MEYQIGEFSIISRLSIKTLRYYHEINLLVPIRIDKNNGYRFYNEKSLEHAIIINNLKSLDFSLNEVKHILQNYKNDKEIITIMKKKLNEINAKLKKYSIMKNNINSFLNENKGEFTMKNNNILVKEINDILICSIRFKGIYSDVGKYFGQLYKTCGRHITGSPFSLYYDEGYKEKDADIEACLQVTKEINTNKLKSHTLKGGKVLSIIHEGSYDTLSTSYKAIFDYKNNNNIEVLIPCREIYLKGPGMIFKGDPKKYLTEIQFLVK